MKYFIDTEFIEDGSTIDLISIGLVAEDGRELYAQFEVDFNKAGDFVARNVLPSLTEFDMGRRKRTCTADQMNDTLRMVHEGRCGKPDCNWYRRSDFRAVLLKFLSPGDETPPKPEFWGYYADYDWVAFCQLFGTMMDLPKGLPMYCRDIKQLCDDLGNPRLPEQGKGEHNALADARWNREAYEFLERR